MSTGTLMLRRARPLTAPILLTGEIVAGRWRQLHRASPVQSGNTLTIPITAIESMAILILCEEGAGEEAVAKIETWVAAPWKLDPGEAIARHSERA